MSSPAAVLIPALTLQRRLQPLDPRDRAHVQSCCCSLRAVASTPTFEMVLERMYERVGLDGLREHLEKAHGITIAKTSQLDVGVFRIDRADGDPLVARLFAAARPHAEAEADLAVLEYLQQVGFRAERPYAPAALSSYEGQSLLVTEFVKGVPKSKQPRYPIYRLGAMVGRLHRLDVPPSAERPAGALHHFAQGTIADELEAVGGWLASIESGVSSKAREGIETLRAAVGEADGGDGLPEALVHPDPVPKNAIFTAAGPILVDWTAAGRGPRLASMTLILRSSWAATPFMKGYARAVTLTAEERDRLSGLLLSRALIGLCFRVCREPKTATGAAKRLNALGRDSEAKADALLQL